MSSFNTYNNMLRITAALQQPTPTTPVGFDRITNDAIAKIQGCAALNAELTKRSELVDKLAKERAEIANALGVDVELHPVGLSEIPGYIQHLRVQLEDTQRAHAKVADELRVLQSTLENSGVSAAEDLARIQKLEAQVDTLIRLLDMAVWPRATAPVGVYRK